MTPTERRNAAIKQGSIISKLILIFFGSGLGSVCRCALSGWAQRLRNGSFPFGTFIVNGENFSVLVLPVQETQHGATFSKRLLERISLGNESS